MPAAIRLDVVTGVLFVCVFVHICHTGVTGQPCKKPIAMPFGRRPVTRVMGLRNHVSDELHMGATWQIRLNGLRSLAKRLLVQAEFRVRSVGLVVGNYDRELWIIG